MNLFYADSKNIGEKSLVIKGQEAEHITKVLRHSIGDDVFVSDGKGNCFKSRIRDFNKNTIFLDILEIKKELLQKPHVTLCLGLIKKRDRLEFAVEKAVELGAAKIVLFKADHSQKVSVRMDRLESTALAAMKQSLRFHLPGIVIEESLEKAVNTHAKNSRVVIADETVSMGESGINEYQHYYLIVGPEGGFSKREREFLAAIQAEYYSLGEKRLRAETAAVVMVDRFANQK